MFAYFHYLGSIVYYIFRIVLCTDLIGKYFTERRYGDRVYYGRIHPYYLLGIFDGVAVRIYTRKQMQLALLRRFAHLLKRLDEHFVYVTSAACLADDGEYASILGGESFGIGNEVSFAERTTVIFSHNSNHCPEQLSGASARRQHE